MNELIATLRESLAHDALTAGDAIDLRYIGDWQRRYLIETIASCAAHTRN
jgi:hypothetical protein